MRIYMEDDIRAKHANVAREEAAAAAKMGPLMALRVVDLTSNGKQGRHSFYLDYVEATIPRLFGDSPLLREGGHGGYTFVFAPVDHGGVPLKGQAGVSPKDVHNGHFALIPLYPIDKVKGAAVDVIRTETAMHTLPSRPKRAFAAAITPQERKNAERSLRVLAELNNVLAERMQAEEPIEGAFVELHVSPRMMWGNPHSIETSADIIRRHAKSGQVDFYEMNIAPHAVMAVIGIMV